MTRRYTRRLQSSTASRGYKLQVRSKNHSCRPLSTIVLPRPTIVRCGSTTPTNQITRRANVLELNTPEACRISGNKITMKKKFVEAGVKTAEYFTLGNSYTPLTIKTYFDRFGTIIAKHKHSSKGNGIFLLENYEDFKNFRRGKDVTQYVFEKYYRYNKEYRLHISRNGCFYTCRKMLKRDAEDRWHRHDSNSVWILEENPIFDKPRNWDLIVADCQRAREAIGLDLVAFDVKCETQKSRPDWIILESNSAPALGDIGIQKYREEITRLCEQTLDV